MVNKAETHIDHMKNELHQVKRDLSASVAHTMQLEKTLQAERKWFIQDRGHHETTQEEIFKLKEEKLEMLVRLGQGEKFSLHSD